MNHPLLATIALSLAASVASAGDWPTWRGPLGTGMAQGSAPTRFGEDEGVDWKVELPGRGCSTPILLGERIFVTTAVPTGAEPGAGEDEPEPGGDEGRGGGRAGRRGFGAIGEQAFVVLCLDRATGKPVWERTLRVAVPHEGFHRSYGSWASASALTDGERLYVSFGSFGLYALDLAGELVWETDPGVQMRMRASFGEGSSPVLAGDVLVQVFDHEADSFVAAFDKQTGKERWRTARTEISTWAWPLVLEHGGVRQVVTSGTEAVRSYAVDSGELVWSCAGLGVNAIPALLRHGDNVIAMTGYRNANLMSIRLGERGVLGGDDIAWSTQKGCAYTASPVLHDGRLYVVMDNGSISCFDAATGKPHYLETRLPRGSQLKASPVGAGDALFVPTESGDVHVVRMGNEYELIATNSLTDQVFIASPAIADGELYLRSVTHLYRIGGKRATREL